MTRSKHLALIVLAMALTWIALVVIDRGLETGAWLTVMRDATVLVALTTLLAILAAAVDDWMDGVVRGGGGIR